MRKPLIPKRNKRGDWQPMFFGLGIVLVLGFLLPLILQDYLNIEDYEPTGFLSPLIEIVQEGVGIFGFNIDIFGLFGEGFKEFILNQLLVFAVLPEAISIPLLLIIISGIVYTIIKMLPTT